MKVLIWYSAPGLSDVIDFFVNNVFAFVIRENVDL